MIYPGLYSGAIGSLLRQIQEQKSQSPIIPPGAEVSTPARDIVEQPNQSIESPGTQRVISQRPEASNVAGGGSAILPETLSPNQSLTYIAPSNAFGNRVDLGAGPSGGTGSDSPEKTVQQFNSIQTNPEFSGVSTQPVGSPDPKYIAPNVSAITRPPDRDYGQPEDFSKYNDTNKKADQFISETNNESKNISALTNYLKNPNDPSALDAYRKTYKAESNKPTQPAPTPAPQQGQVKGATTTAAKKSTPAPFYTKSPISWLATKIFGR